jgi:hypothetical protein
MQVPKLQVDSIEAQKRKVGRAAGATASPLPAIISYGFRQFDLGCVKTADMGMPQNHILVAN